MNDGASSSAHQFYPTVAQGSDGSVVAAWVDSRNGVYDIYLQRFTSLFEKIGDNIKVNTVHNDWVGYPLAIAVSNKNEFAVVWCRESSFKPQLWFQRFSSSGIPIGSNTLLMMDSNGYYPTYPRLHANSNGNYLLLWTSTNLLGKAAINIQYLSPDFSPLTDPVVINEDSSSAYFSFPTVAIADSDCVVVVWRDERDGSDIFLQVVDASGKKQGRNINITEPKSPEFRTTPDVTSRGSDTVLITWSEYNKNFDSEIFGQWYSLDSGNIGMNFKISSDIIPKTDQFNPSTIITSSGNAAVVWNTRQNELYEVRGQIVSKNGLPIGENFRIEDTLFHSSQESIPQILVNSSGHYFVLWQDITMNNYEIYGKKFNENFTELSPAIRINSDQNSGLDESPAVAGNKKGDFIVAWNDSRNDTNNIFAQIYSGNDKPVDTNIKINGSEEGIRWNPSIAIQNDSLAIFTWSCARQDRAVVVCRIFNYASRTLMTVVEVTDTIATVDSFGACVDTDNDGNFVIAWVDGRNGNSDIYAQRFASNGVKLGPNFRVNTDQSTRYQTGVAIDVGRDGDFSIVWIDENSGIRNIYAQKFSSNGDRIGGNFKVNASGTGTYAPEIESDDSGNCIIVWSNYGSTTSEIWGQRYTKSGENIAGNFRIDEPARTTYKEDVTVSTSSTGEFIVTWTEFNSNNFRANNSDIVYQHYSLNGSKIGLNNRLNYFDQGIQKNPAIVFEGSRMFAAWASNHIPGTGFDIWASSLDIATVYVDHPNINSMQFALKQNYPNPFNSSTTIAFTLPAASKVSLIVYDLVGRVVANIISEELQAGEYRETWNAENLPSGIYFYRLYGEGFQKTRKLLLLK
ncbi:MAG: T9SS type A sorting domain-containing protein [Bacteroidota bacterium]